MIILSRHLACFKHDGITKIILNFQQHLSQTNQEYYEYIPAPSLFSCVSSSLIPFLRYLASLSPWSSCNSPYAQIDTAYSIISLIKKRKASAIAFGYTLTISQLLIIYLMGFRGYVTLALIDSQYLFYKRRLINSTSFPWDLYVRIDAAKSYAYELFAKIMRYNIVYISSCDASSVSPLGLSNRNVRIIPNGIDTDYFRPSTKSSTHDIRILFYGDLDYYPNAKVVDYIVETLVPLLLSSKAVVHLAGRCTNSEPLTRTPGLVYHGYVDDLRPLSNQSTIFISPMLYGSGMKNKILEAVSMCIPILCTPEAAAGLPEQVVDSLNIVTIDNFAAALLDMINCLQECDYSRMQKARDWIVSNLSWSSSCSRYCAIIDSCSHN